jgi:nitroreductase
MTLYETIFVRRSVRKYDKAPLDDETLRGIQKFLDEAERIEGQSGRFEIVESDRVKNASAPHYIFAYSEANDGAYANVGYVLQKADLYLQSIGLGSVWLGAGKPVESKPDYVIMLAFGKTEVPLRAGAQDFKRLALDEVSNENNAVAQAARLAPSAANSQPWKLRFEDGKVTVRYFGRGLLKATLKKMNKVDIGIVLRHIEVTLLREGKAVRSVTATTTAGGGDLTAEITYE